MKYDRLLLGAAVVALSLLPTKHATACGNAVEIELTPVQEICSMMSSDRRRCATDFSGEALAGERG